MESKPVALICAIVITVIIIAVANGLAKTSKDTGESVISDWGQAAKQHLTFDGD